VTPDERDRLVRLESKVDRLISDQSEIKAVTDKMKSEQMYARAGLAIIVVMAGAITWIINTAKSFGTMLR